MVERDRPNQGRESDVKVLLALADTKQKDASPALTIQAS